MKIGILCSGVALGVYVPGVYVYRKLKINSICSEMFVLENLLPNDKIQKIKDNKKAFHKNFSVAKMGQKMARDILPSIAKDKLKTLFNTWYLEKIFYFITLSGFWLSILEEFQKQYPDAQIKVECLHIDAVISASWKKATWYPETLLHSWLINFDEGRVVSDLLMEPIPKIPFNTRENRLLIHGGGWGMGTYQSKISELKNQEFNLDVMIYESDEIWNSETDRFYMTDPTWSPWQKKQPGEYSFPPTAEVKKGVTPIYIHQDTLHEVLRLSSNVKAIVSKPGGATLLDSLSAATPLVFLEPFGDHEVKNAALWEQLGYGISYEAWKSTNFDITILEKLHLNLVQKRNHEEKYIEELIKRYKEVSSCSQKLK